MVRGALGLEDVSREDVRFIAVTFGVVVSLIQTYYAPKFNPFTPAHKVRLGACSPHVSCLWVTDSYNMRRCVGPLVAKGCVCVNTVQSDHALIAVNRTV